MGKKFIDKKSSKTYKLVYRSQEDPLTFEEGTSERVFVEVNKNEAARGSKGKEADQTVHQSLRDLQLDDIAEEELDRQAGKAALYGIYLDDREYDYTKHLRPVGTGGGVLLDAASKKEKQSSIEIMDMDEASDDESGDDPSHAQTVRFQLPAEVLPSTHRMNIKAAAFPAGLQPNMDLRVREALEALDDENAEELDDDFLEKLNADSPPSGSEDEYDEDYSDADDDDDDNFDPNDVFAQVRKMKARQRQHASDDSDDEHGESQADSSNGWRGARSASTGFSMSSSAMYRNENLTFLDEQFDAIEAMYEHEDTDNDEERYDEHGHHIPEYDENGKKKSISTRADFENVMNDFLDNYELAGKKMHTVVEGGTGVGKLGTVRDAFLDDTKTKEENKQTLLTTGQRLAEEANGKSKKQEDEELNQYFTRKERTPWDCQTILTTYSTLDNHPATIYEKKTPQIKVNRRTGFPMAECAVSDNDNDDVEMDAADEAATKENKGKPRPQNESKDEKRARKKQLQEQKRDRREVKKDTREVFAEKKDRKKQSKLDRAQYVVHLG
ncbi:Protein ltv1 [Coemansia thaxteri]|uniref:Protein ltv1 n=1 Tax=Coemansia thaxteri TaxID=2663907 RepID=A0A9W8EKT6_9FUNG|nr:Protein ltv1 [Coemansia thaxteri]KAJ2009855.1 Protein ltv1 [Coemansia thaxteri]KAJ2474476.1 Protein ltv1 [Coemansia sp. RSA 2322]KAJ2486065.1 Protein ltv1 [Coemansia sp. RSA 2320]